MRYPLQWLALWVDMALVVEDGDWRRAAECAAELLAPTQMVQPPPVEARLEAVRDAGDRGVAATIAAASSAALAAARDQGYL